MIIPEGAPGVAFGTASDGNPRLDDAARLAIASHLDIPSEWAWVRQVHGDGVVHAVGPGIGLEADAVISTDPALPVAVSVADCLPVAVIADGAVAAVHAGWRGAAAGVVEATLTRLRVMGYEPESVIVGPGIGPCCFEVGPEVAARFPDHVARTSWETTSVDLAGAVVASIRGVRVEQVEGCTMHDLRFHSYRRDGTAERQFGVVWIAPA
jgi:YfiH family protein